MKTEYITDHEKKIELMNLIMEVKQNDLNRFNKSYLTTRIDKNRIAIYFKITDSYQVYFTLIDIPYTSQEILTYTEKEKAYGKIKWIE